MVYKKIRLDTKKRRIKVVFYSYVETHIVKARQQVEEKRKFNTQLKRRHQLIKQMTLQQANYQKLVFDKQKDQPELKVPLPVTGRRELTQLLALTPEKICTKLEDLLRNQTSKVDILTSSELAQIRKLMDRLPDPSNKDQYDVIIRKLLEEIEKLKHIPQARVENVYDMNNNEKIQSIMEYLKYRKRKVKELSTRNDQLVLECQEAEKLLAQRVESLQNDPSVQHALT